MGRPAAPAVKAVNAIRAIGSHLNAKTVPIESVKAGIEPTHNAGSMHGLMLGRGKPCLSACNANSARDGPCWQSLALRKNARILSPCRRFLRSPAGGLSQLRLLPPVPAHIDPAARFGDAEQFVTRQFDRAVAAAGRREHRVKAPQRFIEIHLNRFPNGERTHAANRMAGEGDRLIRREEPCFLMKRILKSAIVHARITGRNDQKTAFAIMERQRFCNPRRRYAHGLRRQFHRCRGRCKLPNALLHPKRPKIRSHPFNRHVFTPYGKICPSAYHKTGRRANAGPGSPNDVDFVSASAEPSVFWLVRMTLETRPPRFVVCS